MTILKKIITVMVLGLFTWLMVSSAWKISRSVATGVETQQFAPPLYGYMKQPPNLAWNASGRFGADYGCLYFASKNYLNHSVMYDSKSDPFGRPAVTFPPNMVFLEAYSLTGLDFPSSVLASNFLQILAFILASFYYLKNGFASVFAIIGGMIGAGFFLFCTPVGATWFERSQTDLYMASAFLIFLKSLRDGKVKDFVLAGLLASLKWTSLPFFAMVGLAYFFISEKPPFTKICLLAVSGLLPFILILPFGTNAWDYIKMVSEWERTSQGAGLSLRSYFSRPMSKALLFIVPCLFVVRMKALKKMNSRQLGWIELVFLASTGFLAACFGAVSYEYKLVCMLFFIPVLVDGRGILFPIRRIGFPWETRVLALVVFLYSFRISLNSDIYANVIDYKRGLVALIASVIVLTLASLIPSIQNLRKRV